ncbi:hypothetical protein MWU59_13930 [Flavobacteriaceae bacterium F08102]|nr:hypothetical protein [Flavobacteriaceae bacterium F08102]
MRRHLLILSLIGFLTACSDPLDKKYNEETLVEDAKEIKEMCDLSEEEVQLMAGWIVRARMKDLKLEGKTYGEILEEAKAYRENKRS